MLPEDVTRAGQHLRAFNCLNIIQALTLTGRLPPYTRTHHYILDYLVENEITMADVVRALDSPPDDYTRSRWVHTLHSVLYNWLGFSKRGIATAPVPAFLLDVLGERYKYTVVAFDPKRHPGLAGRWYPGITLADIRLAGGRVAAHYHEAAARGDVLLEPVPDEWFD